jgi:hypothetical protein
MNKVIGLIGEDPNDTSSIKNLLIQKFNKKATFVTLINNIKGYHLDQPKTKSALEIEYKRKKPDILIFIRDADGLNTQVDKIEKCKAWYKKLSKEIGCNKILLINIWELEALIFADINTFNKLYGTSIKSGRDVTLIGDPKRELMSKTQKLRKKYYASDCPELFKQINIDVVIKNCAYFADFFFYFSAFMEN